jgi:hypothetical protein
MTHANSFRYTNLLFGFLMAGAAAGLLSGLYTGIQLLGVTLPQIMEAGRTAHGPLMINGFLGALISLERAAALERSWSYAAPAGFVAATILKLAGFPFAAMVFLMTGSLFLVVILVLLSIRFPAIWHLIMMCGGVSLLIGNAGYAGGLPVSSVVHWWAAFPVLTIFGERLELNRLMRPPARARQVFGVLVVMWLACLGLTHFSRDPAWTWASILLILMALWLLKYDIARRTIKTREWTRYSALNMLTAYGWILIAGIAGIIYGYPIAGPVYDALLHLYFVGFVFSMIFAHAAIIIPALIGVIVPWSRYFYLPWALLGSGLIMRVAGGIIWIPELRLAGAYANAAAILLFLGGIMVQILRNRHAISRG